MESKGIKSEVPISLEESDFINIVIVPLKNGKHEIEVFRMKEDSYSSCRFIAERSTDHVAGMKSEIKSYKFIKKR